MFIVSIMHVANSPPLPTSKNQNALTKSVKKKAKGIQ